MGIVLLAGLTFFAWAVLGSFLLLGDRRLSVGQGTALFFVFPLAGALAVVPSLGIHSFFGPWVPELPSLPAGVVSVWLLDAPAEELFKFLLFVLSVRLFRPLRHPVDGVLLGASVGLGFGLAENFLYGIHGGWELLVLRTLVSLPGHLVYGAIWGGCFGLEFSPRSGDPGRPWVPLLALVPVVFFHGLSDTLVFFGAPPVLSLGTDGALLGLGALLYFQSQGVGRRAS